MKYEVPVSFSILFVLTFSPASKCQPQKRKTKTDRRGQIVLRGLTVLDEVAMRILLIGGNSSGAKEGESFSTPALN